MKLTWLGHACFLLEQEGYRIVIDPYNGVEGYPPLRVEAHEALCSHGHFDHNFTEAVTLLPPRESPFSIWKVETCHDEQGGALRGSNAIHIFAAGGITVAHLGDLGHPLTAEQVSAVGPVDAVLTPIGGTYTVDAAGAKAVCETLKVPCVVPMHYRHSPYGLLDVAGLEPFLALWRPEQVRRLPGNSFLLEPGCTGVWVPEFLKE